MKIGGAVGSLALVLALGAARCGGVAVDSKQSHEAPPPEVTVSPGISRSEPGPSQALTFPPTADDRRQRPALPDRFAPAADKPLALLSPEPGDRAVASDGRTLRFFFNQPMAGARPQAPAGKHIQLSYGDARATDAPLMGLAVWEDDRVLVFTASSFLDPDRSYHAQLHDLETVSGKSLAAPLQLAVESTTGAVIAGKGVGHLPVAGKPRVVASSDGGGDGAVPTLPRLRVLYDQPIHIDLARTLVSLRDSHGQEVPLSVWRAAADSWQGTRVDRRFVVDITPRRLLERGETYQLLALDGDAASGGRRHEVSLTVADPMKLVGVECGWWTRNGQTCEQDGATLRTDGREVHLRFNNRIAIAHKRLPAHVAITPRVRNLVVASEGWDHGRLVLTGDFRPSTKYSLKVAGLKDRFGQRQAWPVELTVETASLGASVSMPEGLVLLDAARTEHFAIHSRNLSEAELRLWRVDESDVRAFQEALARAHAGEIDQGPPDHRINIPIQAERDTLVASEVDLRSVTSPSASYLATIVPTTLAFSSALATQPRGSAAAKPPVALIKPGHADSLAVHVHASAGTAVVHVARLVGGAPVAGAEVGLQEDGATATTNAHGVAVLPRGEEDGLVRVRAGSERMLLPIASGSAASSDLFPTLSSGEVGSVARRGLVITDRGIYRPGARIGIKASVYRVDGDVLRPVAGEALSVQVLGPTGDEVCSSEAASSAMGTVVSSCELPPTAKVGLHRIVASGADGEAIARQLVRVADFEPPRFKVDVELAAASDKGRGALSGVVRARYLFGAAMDGAWTRWAVTRQPAQVPTGPLSEAGLVFSATRSWFDEDEQEERQSWTGEGALGADGTMSVNQAIAFDAAGGPQRFTLEADVGDASYRHVAGRQSVVIHPAARYAGLSGPRGWVGVGQQIEARLGVIDTSGKALLGATVSAKLLRTTWRWIDRRGPGGSLHTEWRRSEREVARCSVVSAAEPSICKLRVPSSGDYQLVAEVDGRRGGSSWFWAWREGDTVREPVPSRGNVVQIASDKARYQPGDTARLLVRSPYPAATALVTTEMGALLRQFEQRIDGSAGVVELPIKATHAPHVHATITLLPIGARGPAAASYRVGAIRLPVALSGARLDVAVSSDKPSYGPGDEVEVTVKVRDGGTAEPHAEVALAVVDEGVLRLTDFHAADPVPALRPPTALGFSISDSRSLLSDVFAKSHVAGDGGGDEIGSLPNTRRKFVQTALWKPQLATDAAGVARVRFVLPDNLTEFRMMAVVVDDEGKGGRSESSFEVNKPVLIEPLLPRFAHVGDRFELAAMVHNTTEAVFQGSAWVAGRELPLNIAAEGRERVAVAWSASLPGDERVTMEVRDADGNALDRVERVLAVAQAGVDAHPSISGAFRGKQSIALRVPEAAMVDEGTVLTVRVGEHLWPEVGERLEYLLRYPHGCVEQTTSSTLPLLAAREIFPRIGVDKHDESFYRERVQVGLERLASMRTPSGGLGYWPGESEPNVYGTAYAMRAVVRADQAGIPLPVGLKAGMVRYLSTKLLSDSTDPDVRAAIAQSLAEVDSLPPGIVDALYHLRDSMDLFGKASLTIALGKLPEQRDQVDNLLDEMEAALVDADGTRVQHDGYHDWGSPSRTNAQVAMALSRLRRSSTRLPPLVRGIAEKPAGYTTQSTAYGLLALADHLSARPADGAAVQAKLDGTALEPVEASSGSGREYRIPLKDLVGRAAELELHSPGNAAVGFAVTASYRVPIAAAGETVNGALMAASLPAASAEAGADVYRVMTTPKGDLVDPQRIRAGDLVRVALLVRFPDSAPRRLTYLAISDRLPAGFEPVDPDLATVSSPPDVGTQHPFSPVLLWNHDNASHVELRDDRVHIYFDRLWGREVAATYLVRATTPGSFAQPPAAAELMYEADSTSYSEGSQVTIL